MSHSHKFGNDDLDEALKSLRAEDSRGVVLVGETNCVTAVKQVDDEAESVLLLHCLECKGVDHFTKSSGADEWTKTPYVNSGCSEFI